MGMEIIKPKSKIIIIIFTIVGAFFVTTIIHAAFYYSNAITLIDGMVFDLMYDVEETYPLTRWISEENLQILDFFPEENKNKSFSARSDFSFNILKKITLKTLTVKRKENVSFIFSDGTKYSYKGTFLITTEYNGEYWNITGVTLDNN